MKHTFVVFEFETTIDLCSSQETDDSIDFKKTRQQELKDLTAFLFCFSCFFASIHWGQCRTSQCHSRSISISPFDVDVERPVRQLPFLSSPTASSSIQTFSVHLNPSKKSVSKPSAPVLANKIACHHCSQESAACLGLYENPVAIFCFLLPVVAKPQHDDQRRSSCAFASP